LNAAHCPKHGGVTGGQLLSQEVNQIAGRIFSGCALFFGEEASGLAHCRRGGTPHPAADK
jgi:hypothetical protein